ncbi:MAG: hypothetical protein GWO20_08910, partial [Candidatus Korarchaeota archaeon]|nr:hypothetical protein [Candidatus Korarchaeota archaeon]
MVNDSLSFKYGREELVARLYESETEVVHVTTLRQLNRIVKKEYDKAIKTAHDRVLAENDAIVYESYADVALPWKGIVLLDLVLAIYPGYVQAYNPEKYFSAI